MIKNERQYRITRAQADKFARALADLEAHPEQSQHLPPALRKAEREALASQLATLRQQVADYEALRSGQRGSFTANSFAELPRTLIQARIAAGLSQKELAARVGLKPQQIQRYEATEYASASMDRVNSVVEALNLEVRTEARSRGPLAVKSTAGPHGSTQANARRSDQRRVLATYAASAAPR